MKHHQFKIAFWHPFGPHGEEEPDDIIQRKKEEIELNGWTLWSFQHRRMLKKWYSKLPLEDSENIYAFCSNSKNPKEPKSGKTMDSTHYKLVGTEEWKTMPKCIRSPHPYGKNKYASAFVVRKVIHPVGKSFPHTIAWLGKDETWRYCTRKNCDPLPTRGEYLIRRRREGASLPKRGISAVLELKPPYLAYLKADLKAE